MMLRQGEGEQILVTKRLRLRPMVREDAPHVVGWRNSPEASQMMAKVVANPLSEQEHLGWFERTREHRLDHVIERRSGGAPIGAVSFDWARSTFVPATAELGKILATDAHGHGYAKEATRAWLYFGFAHLGIEQVFSRSRAENVANRAVNGRLGFEVAEWPSWLEFPEGAWVFSVLKKESWERLCRDGEP